MNAIQYKTIRDDLITLFEDNLSSINTGLTTGSTFADGTNIKAGNPMTTNIYDYPVILVRLDRKTEEWHTVGARTKLAEVTYQIYPMTRIYDDGQSDEDETMTLVANIEDLIRENISFSSTVKYCQPVSVDFFPMAEDGTYISAAMIELVCTILVT